MYSLKKIFNLIIILVFLSSLVSGFTFAEVFDSHLSNLITGSVIKNKVPVVTINYPTNNMVMNINPVEFGWLYKDVENDKLKTYEIQLGTDRNFKGAFYEYGLDGSTRKIYLKDGDVKYYWRIRAQDNFGWGEWSAISEFILDTTVKTCSDGTKFWGCADNVPIYCDGGVIIDDCLKCGCPGSSRCLPSGRCQESTCFDGTVYSRCSVSKPDFCQDGVLKKVCSLCGCPDGSDCDSDGSCSKTLVFISNGDVMSDPGTSSILALIVNFFKSIFK